MKQILVWLAFLSLILGTPAWALESTFKIILQVIDETGKPVEGALAAVGYLRGSFTKESERVGGENELTDAQGRVTLGGAVLWGGVSLGASKEGYYRNWSRYEFHTAQFGRWQPWNPTVPLVLKKIGHPAPMYAKKQVGMIPRTGEAVGYDLAVGDWVEPYGKGKAADMLLLCVGEVQDSRNYHGELTVVFPGVGNGLHAVPLAAPDGSELRMDAIAPEDGYVASRKWRYSRQVEKMIQLESVDDSDKNQNFYFRVRSVVDANGKVLSAWYGKIQGDIIYDPRGKNGLQTVGFTYYLNPDGTRNVEFDPARNLFTHLGTFEKVRAP